MRAAAHYEKADKVEDSENLGSFVKRPSKETLTEWCQTMTVPEIGEKTGATAKRVRDWLRKLSLKARPVVNRARQPMRPEIMLGSVEAVLEWIETHDISEAVTFFKTTDQVCHRWERHYGKRFKRTCRHCSASLPYEQMAQRDCGRIYTVCQPCFDKPNREPIMSQPGKVYASSIHHERVSDEYDGIHPLIRKPIGKPFGGEGWHNFAGVEMARMEAWI